MARETINGISVPIPGTGEPPDFVSDLRRIASDIPTTIAERQSVAHFEARRFAEGALPSTGYLDNGVAYETSGIPFTVSDGALMSAGSLAYLNIGQLGGDITVMELECEWVNDGKGAGNDQGFVLINANGPFANDYPTYADTGAHLLGYPDVHYLQKRRADGGGSTGNVAAFFYVTPFADPVPFGTRVTYRITRQGNTLYVKRHDGGVKSYVMDADMLDWCGPYSCVEIVGDAATNNRIKIHSFRVSTEPSYQFFKPGQSDSASVAQPPSTRALKAPGAITTTLTPSFQTVLTKPITIPDLKAGLVIASLPVDVEADGNLSISFSVEGNPTSVISTTLLVGQAYDGNIIWSAPVDLSEFTAQTTRTLWARLAHSGTGAYKTSNSGPLRIPTLSFVPATPEWT